MNSKLLPRSLKNFVKAKLERAVMPDPFVYTKYLPYQHGQDHFIIPGRKDVTNNSDVDDHGLVVPPADLWIGGPTREFYLFWGKKDVTTMMRILSESGHVIRDGANILEFGCREGRMIRHLNNLSNTCNVWGVDASSTHIYWCKQNLSPPFHFATTTTIPHLPFRDEYFDFIYAGSVFTHIDDLAESWLLELNRILSSEGRIYLTIQDKHTIKVLEDVDNARASEDHDDYLSTRLFSSFLNSNEVYKANKNRNFGMFVMGRDTNSYVFYDIDYFCDTLSVMFDVISITMEAYSEFQTAVLCKRK